MRTGQTAGCPNVGGGGRKIITREVAAIAARSGIRVTEGGFVSGYKVKSVTNSVIKVLISSYLAYLSIFKGTKFEKSL